MQLLASNSTVLRNLKHIDLMENIHGVVSHECKTNSKLKLNVVPACYYISSADHSYGDSWSSLWLPFDLILEDALDGGQVAAFSAIEIIAGMFFFVLIIMLGKFLHKVENLIKNKNKTTENKHSRNTTVL